MAVKKKSNDKLVIGVAVMIIFAAAGLGYWWFIDNGNSAEISVTVYSIHITETVSVIAFVDGEQVLVQPALKPGHYTWTSHYYVYTFSILDSAKIITVSAQSVGGGLGPVYDEEKIMVVDGGRYSVILYV